jgi:hypothetical protein
VPAGESVTARNSGVQRLGKELADQQVRLSHLENFARDHQVALSNLESLTRELQEKLLSNLEALMMRQTEQFPEYSMVLSLPKCGGYTLADTLHGLYRGRVEILHAHYLTPAAIRHSVVEMEETLSDCDVGQETSAALRDTMLGWANIARNFRRLLSDEKREIVLLGGVREPIALLVSIWFQGRHSLSLELSEDLQPQKVAEFVMETFSTNPYAFLPLESWFDNEIKATTGIDVFSAGFDTARGYEVYRHGKVRYALIRLDRMNHLPLMLEDVFDIPADLLPVKSLNRAEDRPHQAAVYKRITHSITFPEEFVSEVYSTKYAQTFWTPDELAKYASRWVGKRSA